MKIATRYQPPPIPQRDFDWYALDSDTYDGAPDAGAASTMGWGRTEQEAIDDLLEQFEEGRPWQQKAARQYRGVTP